LALKDAFLIKNMITIIIFIIFLGFLLLIHEAGHFFSAKYFKVKVEEFGIGLPPRLWKKKIKETIYSINLLPFGGFVRILGEDGDEETKKRKDSFSSQKPSKRMTILLAGVVLNFLAGIVFLSIGYSVGIPVIADHKNDLENVHLSILAVDNDSPAELSGVEVGDIVLGVNFEQDKLEGKISVDSFKEFVSRYQGEEIVLNLQKPNQERIDISVLARKEPPKGKGALGIAIGEVGIAQYPFFKSIWQGIKNSGRIFINTFIAVYYLIRGLFAESGIVGELVGPVGIAVMGGQTVKLGLGYLLQFLAGLSINLAALNLIPFPGLDGGRMIFVLIEKIKKSPVSRKIEGSFHSIGFLILLLLLMFITARDIIKLF
jgi:regulator of sigma E protease